MKNLPFHSSGLWLLTAIFLLPACSTFAAMDSKQDASLQAKLDKSIQSAFKRFNKLGTNQLAVTVVDLRDPDSLKSASYRGDERIYPASVVKLFYLEAAHRWMQEGKLKDTPELRRAMKDMIVLSYNEATHYVLDLLTGTTSGPELSAAQMEEWSYKRNAVNRYFQSRGYSNINANQKPWCEGPYGRERRFVGEAYTNRNMLTTDATARLLTEIALRQAISPARSEQMLELLKRDPHNEQASANSQDRGFTGPAVPKTGKLWSKSGWTSQTRHDAAYLELDTGAKFVIVTFTVDHADEREIIPHIARELIGHEM